MNDLEKKVNEWYLSQLDNRYWLPHEPSMDFGIAALSYFSAAFEREQDPQRRALLVEIIWEFRDLAALPALAKSLYDPSPLVWKEALNGLVTLDLPEYVQVIETARTRPFKKEKDSIYFKEWLDEAIQQIREGIYGEKIIKAE